MQLWRRPTVGFHGEQSRSEKPPFEILSLARNYWFARYDSDVPPQICAAILLMVTSDCQDFAADLQPHCGIVTCQASVDSPECDFFPGNELYLTARRIDRRSFRRKGRAAKSAESDVSSRSHSNRCIARRRGYRPRDNNCIRSSNPSLLQELSLLCAVSYSMQIRNDAMVL